MLSILDPRRMKIFHKLVLTCLLASVPLSAVGLVLNETGARTVHNDITNSTQAHLHFYLNALELEVDRLQRQKNDFISDDDLQKLSTLAPAMKDFERTQSILRIQNRLAVLKSSSMYVQDVKVFIPMVQHTVSTDNFGEVMSEQELQMLARTVGKKPSPFVRWDNHLIIGQLYPELINSTRAPVFALEIELSVDKIRETLAQIGAAKGGAFIVSNDNAWSVQQDPNDTIAQSMMKDLLEAKPELAGEMYSPIGGRSYWIIYQKSGILNATMAYYVPQEEAFGPLVKYRIWFWSLSVLSLMIILLSSYSLYRVIHRPLRNMIEAFRKLQNGDFTTIVEHRWNDEFQYLYGQFNKMSARLSTLIQEVYEQKIRKQRAELKHLQAQINPHFLYNSFFLLYRMAKLEDLKNLVLLTKYLSDYFQFVTRSAADEVSLEQEVNHARAYAEIQSLRFQNQLTVQFEALPEAWRQAAVPRLILQPTLENAFQYGLEDRAKGGILQVSFEEADSVLRIVVEDNGEKLTDELLDTLSALLAAEDSTLETTGLLNVHRRLILKLGEEAGLGVSRSRLGGLCVTILIPMERNGYHEQNSLSRQ